jgi:hypothetical protein
MPAPLAPAERASSSIRGGFPAVAASSSLHSICAAITVPDRWQPAHRQYG